MIRLSLMLFAACVGTYTFAEDKKEVPKALLPFQGTWVVKEMTGDSIPPKEKWPEFTFAGDKVGLKIPGQKREESAEVNVDPDKKPAALDILPDGKAENTIKAIYKFDKETLTLCFAFEGEKKDRPTEFKAQKGYTLLVLQKAKK